MTHAMTGAINLSLNLKESNMTKELKEAQRRIDLGEPLSTTAAEMGLTPSELTEMLEGIA